MKAKKIRKRRASERERERERERKGDRKEITNMLPNISSRYDCTIQG